MTNVIPKVNNIMSYLLKNVSIWSIKRWGWGMIVVQTRVPIDVEARIDLFRDLLSDWSPSLARVKAGIGSRLHDHLKVKHLRYQTIIHLYYKAKPCYKYGSHNGQKKRLKRELKFASVK